MSLMGQTVSTTFLSLSFLVGAPGNLLVIWIILRHVRPRSHTILLLLHLAAADLLVLVTLPLWIHSLLYSWVFGEVFCTATVYTIHVCMYASIFLLTLMSIERFVAICYPFVFLSSCTKAMLNVGPIVAWVVALALALPVILAQRIDGDEQCLFREYSSVTQEVMFLSLETVVGFVAPFIILSVCNCLIARQLRAKSFQGKMSVMVLITSVVVAFALCWLPHHINNVVQLVCTAQGSGSCVNQSVTLISGALVFASSAVNPVLYAFAARRSKVRIKGLRLVKMFQEVASQTREHWGSARKEADTCDIELSDGRPTVI
ncbi:hypothetical protein NHX12_006055 [Muraenolepis orangiensis]|uniref:G-protein coupled receptors family 1 profile domain-containing protein n=1 Tax=Muraenolepis orangiensis TaxID=630683 RepID=A0A9Q0DSL1_9TELE|nr:hypothetical protein NHX12_006055 [Muraenolepis orangiensis]